MPRCVRAFILALLFLSFSAHADLDVRDADAAMFPAGTEYDPAIPTPAAFLGFELGRHPVRHHQLVDYVRTVAAASSRLSVETIGYSHERRPIEFLVATSVANHARLDDIRRAHVALTQPGSGQTVSDDMPVVTWLNYGVHGAESSGMDAALPFIYYLAAARGPEIDEVLENSVVLVTAVFNPDGHAQRISWFDAYGGERMIADPGHAEHEYSWQHARTNHYGFDLNRQWLLLTQPEPRAWVEQWHAWRPNLTVDYHEMGSAQTYYFHPGVRTRTNPLVPERAEALMAATVRGSEELLDAEARLYYHGEGFDNFYIGKGSTFPLVNGGVGVLFEAGAALGREVETDNGLRTYRENIRKHFRTSIGSIETAVELRREYLEYQQAFYDSALAEAERADARAWVVSADGDTARLHFFADLLNRHRIETFRLARDLDIGERTFAAADSLVVPVRQPQYRLIRSLFETLTEFEDATFYDVSTWILPPAFGLAHAPLAGRTFKSDLVGEAWAPPRPTAAPPAEANYAYAFEWSAYFAPRALQRIVEAGLLARVALKPFTATTSQGQRTFGRGSIVVPFDRQSTDRPDIHALMDRIAAEDGVAVMALVSGRSAIGTEGVDLGGPSFQAVSEPSVLLVTGDGINLYDAGEVWHLLDHRMDMPLTLRHRDRLAATDWSRYSHIVFPGGNYEDYAPEFLDRLRQWVREGGTLVALRHAVPWARAQVLEWVNPAAGEPATGNPAPSAEPAAGDDAVGDDTPQRIDYADRQATEAIDLLGGAIFSADLDTTHPLGFGYARRELFLHKNVREPLAPSENPYATVIAYTDAPLHSGYASKENVEALAGTPALLAERLGAGSVILFADNPNFRGYWYGTNKLFLNSLFFSTAFQPPAEQGDE